MMRNISSLRNFSFVALLFHVANLLNSLNEPTHELVSSAPDMRMAATFRCLVFIVYVVF